MKKGFTLIELLAVIVILAIIALIAVPTITGIVSRAKEGSIESSVNGYVEAVEQAKAINMMNDEESDDLDQGIYTLPLTQYNVKVKGQEPSKGWIEVTKTGVGRYSLVIGDYTASYDGKDKTVVKGEKTLDRPKIYPEYVYSQEKIATKIGMPIDSINFGKMYTASSQGLKMGFATEAECQYMVQATGTNANCVYEDYITPDLKYLTSPKSTWEAYLKYKVTNDGLIESAQACRKGNICLDPSLASETADNIILEMDAKFPNMTRNNDLNNNYIGRFLDKTFIGEVKMNSYVGVVDGPAQTTCGVYQSGIIGCTDFIFENN